MKEIHLPKWAVVLVLGAVLLQLVADWAAPGAGTRLACDVLRASCGDYQLPSTNYQFPLWGWIVGLVGKDVAALAWISVASALLDLALVTFIFGSLFGAAVRRAKVYSTAGTNEFPFAVAAGTLLAAVAFLFTPGFLVAATRVGPLMTALLPVLAAVALVVWVVGLCSHGDETSPLQGAAANYQLPSTNYQLIKKGKGRLFLAVLLLGCSAFELFMARRVFLSLALPALWVWLAVGVMPAFVIAWCVRKRWLVSKKSQGFAFGGWALAVAVMATVAFTSGRLDEGRAANRLVAQIVANAEEGGKVALVSDGVLDDLYFFMLPEKIQLISLKRERDPEYGRKLSEWVRDLVVVGSRSRTAEEKDSIVHCTTTTNNYNYTEDLAFAAELGPRALIDEWTKLDKAGFEAQVASVANFFPTREKWDEACGELDGMRSTEPLAKYLRHLVAVCGNALACRMLESGKVERLKGGDAEREAWGIFKTIVDKVDPKNYAAYLNLLGMVQRGYAVPKDEVADLTKRRQQIEKNLKSWEHILRAARSGGRLYADPEGVAKYEKMQKEAAAKRELSPEAQAFVEKVAAAPKDPKSGKVAQEAIHKALREDKVRIDKIGGHLITIDLALGDRENAEKDAIDVLKVDRHNPTANATLGTFAGARGDYERAERYLKRAIATGKASISAKNDYAWALYRLGRVNEAEPFAREAVKLYGEYWASRETLAAILIRQEKYDEAERELQKAEELAEKAGIPKGKVVSLEIDRARLLKAKGDYEHFKMKIRSLKNRKDLSEEQQREVKGMDW